MTARPEAPATERNRQPILEVLQIELRDIRTVLEIGSGTGQHAVFFAAEMPHLHWQTSDLESNHPGIVAWIAWAKLENVASPLLLDMRAAVRQVEPVDAVYSSNTAHIMSAAEVKSMFGFVGENLKENGVFCLYGPFNEHGEFSSQSNLHFDASLKKQDERMGIRDIDDLKQYAERAGMSLARRYALPANNQIIIWQKNGRES